MEYRRPNLYQSHATESKEQSQPSRLAFLLSWHKSVELDIDISANTKSGKHPGLTPRVLLLMLLLAPANAYILVEMEVVRYTYPTWIVPLANVVFTLMVVVILNDLIRRMAPRIALRQDELLVLHARGFVLSAHRIV